METLIGLLKEIPDPRRGNAIRHRLEEVLAIAVIATLCGCGRYTEMAAFAEVNEEWLRKYMGLPGGVPSHDTFGDVMAAISPGAIATLFFRWMQSLKDRRDEETAKECTKKQGPRMDVVALDGKVARRCHGACADGPDVVSAWACGARVVLGQLACEEKSNEITAIPRLLEMLELYGCVVTIDAIGTQKEIAKAILEKHADYVLTVKGNQPGLLKDIELFFSDMPKGTPTDSASTIEKSHGRIEERECVSVADAGWLTERHPGWEGISGIGLIRSRRCVQGAPEGQWEEHYVVFSKALMTAAELLEAKRAHWGVESSLHWVLDMDFREDEARMRSGNAAKNMAAIRRICVSLLQAQCSKPKRSVNIKQKMCLMSSDYREEILGLT